MNDDDDDPNDSGIEIVDTKPSKATLKSKTALTSTAGPSYQRESKAKSETKPRRGVNDLLSVVQASIDPAAHAQCDEAKVSYSFLLAHISALEAESREKDSRVEKLQAELCECKRGRNSAECETNSLCSRMQMLELMQQMRGSFGAAPSSSLSAATGC